MGRLAAAISMAWFVGLVVVGVIFFSLFLYCTPAKAQLQDYFVIGDSLSSCAQRGPAGPCWPELVRMKSHRAVLNISHGGMTMAYWSQRDWDQKLVCPIFPDHCKVIVYLGANDATLGAGIWQFYRTSFQLLIVKLDFVSERILLLQPIRVGPRGQRYARAGLNELLKLACWYIPDTRCVDLSFMPLEFFLPHFSGRYLDLHPTAAGHEWIAARVMEAMESDTWTNPATQ